MLAELTIKFWYEIFLLLQNALRSADRFRCY
jgi:hypothetical protein